MALRVETESWMDNLAWLRERRAAILLRISDENDPLTTVGRDKWHRRSRRVALGIIEQRIGELEGNREP